MSREKQEKLDAIEALQVKLRIGADCLDSYVMLAIGRFSGDLDPLYGLSEAELGLVLTKLQLVADAFGV